MTKLPEVEEAKALMTEAEGWSVVQWLREKKRVRRAADAANAALDRVSKATRAKWNGELRAAYEGKTDSVRPEVAAKAQKSKKADEEAERAHLLAEKTFDDAEKQLSTRLAREGCRQAIASWEMHEKAIEVAEGMGNL